jgi:hypothetical protein
METVYPVHPNWIDALKWFVGMVFANLFLVYW